MRQITRVVLIAGVCAAATGLSGCVGVSVTAQERPFLKALDDFSARTDLNARLLAEDPLLFANVSTTVVEGRVHLAGTVASPEQRERAQQLAWTSPNVREVINNIEVTRSGGILETAGDRWISGQVRARILSDSGIRDSNYTIDTQNNVVYIMGIAQSSDELDRVLSHAAVVPGVAQVVNYAVLKDDPRRFDAPAPEAPREAPSASSTFWAPDTEAETLVVSPAQPPVLTDDRGGGLASSTPPGGFAPEPVEVQQLPSQDDGQATGKPRSLLR
jgi:osmotically-inducible protein OsmY